MRKPGIWGLGFRIIRIADVIDDAGTTTGIVVHVAGNNTLFNQIVHIAPHGDNGQPDMAGNVITGMSLLGGVTEVAFNEGKGLGSAALWAWQRSCRLPWRRYGAGRNPVWSG